MPIVSNRKRNVKGQFIRTFNITYCCKICGNRIGSTSALQGKGTCNFCANSKENNPRYIDGRTKNAKYYCKICNKAISITSHNYGKGRCRHCYMLSHLPVKIIHCEYKNNSFRSSWELLFAKWLDLSGIKWQYESKTFDLVNTTYTPDFYLPEFDCYIEIKGWWRDDAKKKFKKFIQRYNKIKIKVLGIQELKKLKIL
jgi:hypothetical protein